MLKSAVSSGCKVCKVAISGLWVGGNWLYRFTITLTLYISIAVSIALGFLYIPSRNYVPLLKEIDNESIRTALGIAGAVFVIIKHNTCY